MTPGMNELREQVHRILDSKTFRHSEIQRRLLSYLFEKYLAGEASALKEYALGVDVLSKPESYDPRHDSSVRFQIGKLRQRIFEYYQTEGQADPIIVDLPKGHFELGFCRRELRIPAPMADDRIRHWRRLAIIFGAALALTAGFAGFYWLLVVAPLQRADRAEGALWSPELREIWAPFLSERRPVTLCIGDPLFIQLPSVSAFARFPPLNEWDQAEKSEQVRKLAGAFGEPEPIPWYNFTGIGEASGAVLLGRLLGSAGGPLVVTASSRLSWDQIAANNVIFVGPPKFNLQLAQVPIDQMLVIEGNGIRNLRPKPGEPAFFPEMVGGGSATRDSGVAHALVSNLPGPHGRGHIMVLACNRTRGTHGAVQYVTEPHYARDLTGRIRLPSGSLPAYYQLVVKVTYNAGVPVRVAYVTHRALDARIP